MKKFNFSDYKGKDVVMHCKTEEEANEFCRWKHENGDWWCDGKSFLEENYFDDCGSETCYMVNRGEYCSLDYFIECRFKVLEMSDFWKPEEEGDPVNHPYHYTSGDIECIDAIRASMSHEAFCGYLKGNVIKYLWRYQLKVNPVEDLKKADWYLEKLEEEEAN